MKNQSNDYGYDKVVATGELKVGLMVQFRNSKESLSGQGKFENPYMAATVVYVNNDDTAHLMVFYPWANNIFHVENVPHLNPYNSDEEHFKFIE